MATDKYFDKKKTTALTLTSLGSSLSIVVFSPVAKLLLENYGFRGTMMIFSAILLNTVVCGVAVIPLNTKSIYFILSIFSRYFMKSHVNIHI